MSLDDIFYPRDEDNLTQLDNRLIQISGNISKQIPFSPQSQLQAMNIVSFATLFSSLYGGGLIGGFMMIDSFMDMLNPSVMTPLLEEKIYALHGIPRWVGKIGRLLAIGATGYFCSKTLGSFASDDVNAGSQLMMASCGALLHTYALYLSKAPQ